MNPMQIMQMFKNPQAFMQNMMNNSEVGKNPMLKNAMEMAQKGDAQGVEQLARNLCKEKGVNPDEAIGKIRSQFSMK